MVEIKAIAYDFPQDESATMRCARMLLMRILKGHYAVTDDICTGLISCHCVRTAIPQACFGSTTICKIIYAKGSIGAT